MEWYYEHNGQQAGPVSRAEMIRLIVQRRIRPDTLVWTAEFGDQWRPAAQAGLIAPISVTFMKSGEKGAFSMPLPPPSMGKKVPPEQVPSVWSWLLLLPGLLNYMLLGAETLRGHDPFQASVLEVFLLAMILMTALILDRKTLLQHGYRPPSFLWFFLFGLCPPCYLWSRYAILKKGMPQLILAVLMWAGMVGLEGYYLYQHPEFFAAQLQQMQKGGAGSPPWLKGQESSKQNHEPPSKGGPSSGQDAPGGDDGSADQGEIQL
ncbi:DUF4339 domain-containing protein [Acetobacteraceae bacterium ESL0709]|nr:DUF4339 domain-containing protein [Acetobacteraceae bacterium ESL0697]MDF7678654.1 DUF4339 domain-containing protein [Acetobacteraceae bacterium ESL0709]